MDRPEYDIFFRTYYPLLLAYANQFVSKENAQEIVQELMAWFWVHFEEIDWSEGMKGYLFKAVKNRAMNVIYHKKIHEKMVHEISEKMPFVDNPDYYAVEALMDNIEQAIDKLKPELREPFAMNRFQAMSYKQIAQVLNVSVQTVAYRIMQALKLLREDLQEYLPKD